MAEFNKKSFNANAFGAYVKRIPSARRNELAKSRAIGSNIAARKALSGQTGSLYARVPYFGRIDGATSQNNDGSTNIVSSTTTSYEQGFITASRMDAWTERSFSGNITSGVDFMDNVAAQISDYKFDVEQRIILSILSGIFSMKTDKSSVSGKAASEFLKHHIYDISGESGEAAYVAVDTLNKAIQKACGDNKNLFKLVIMNSAVASRLENLKLIRFMTQVDEKGIERELELGTWNGRLVLVDDNLPVNFVGVNYSKTNDEEFDETKEYFVKSGEDYSAADVLEGSPKTLGYYEKTSEGEPVYTTYVLGENSIILDNIGDRMPYEMYRDPKTNGGEDTLYVRDRYICGVDGISFEKPASITASAANSDLSNGENWRIINDGVKAIPHKSIAVCKIISKG